MSRNPRIMPIYVESTFYRVEDCMIKALRKLGLETAYIIITEAIMTNL